MKAVILLFFCFNLFAAEISKESQISTVSVFKNRAFITREMKNVTKSGNHSFVFYPVTPNLNMESLKVLTKNRGVKILGIRTKVIQLKESYSPEYKKLNKEKISIGQKIASLSTKVTNLLKEHIELKNLSKYYQESFSLNLQNKKWSKSNLLGFINFMDSRNKKMKGSWSKAFHQFLKLTDRQTFIHQKMYELGANSLQSQLKVWVDTKVEKDQTVKLSLQYMVFNAGWNPIYDIRINSKKSTAKIAQSAFVWQNSGEDWTNVKLVLSNQRSELKPKIPHINSYTLSFKEVKKVKTIVTSSQTDSKDLNEAKASSYSSEDLAKSFVANSRQTIKTNRAKIKVPLKTQSSAYKEWRELVASQFPKVYKKGEIKNPFSYALAPGYVNIFYNGDFITKFYKDFTQKGEFFHINAGIDYSITINRGYENKSEKAGLLNNKMVYKRKFSTSMKNFAKYKKMVRVYEQIPESELENVKVSFKTKNKKYTKDKSRPSWIYWDLKLSADKVTYLDHVLTIETPKDFKFSW